MAGYTSNVPQANQQIAATQVPILSNFGFLATGIGTEHNFNASGSGSDMWHLRASMPNQADPVALPGTTNGMYYVGSDSPKFYDGATAYFLNISVAPQSSITGTKSIGQSFVTIATLPANSVGQVWLFEKATSGTVGSTSAGFQFSTDNTSLQAYVSTGSAPGMIISSTGLSLQARQSSGSSTFTYTYLINYFNP